MQKKIQIINKENLIIVYLSYFCCQCRQIDLTDIDVKSRIVI